MRLIIGNVFEFKEKFPSVLVMRDHEHQVLDTIEKQVAWGFTREEAEENLKDSEYHFVSSKELLVNCVDKAKVKDAFEEIHDFIADEFDKKFKENSKVGLFTADLRRFLENKEKRLLR